MKVDVSSSDSVLSLAQPPYKQKIEDDITNVKKQLDNVDTVVKLMIKLGKTRLAASDLPDDLQQDLDILRLIDDKKAILKKKE